MYAELHALTNFSFLRAASSPGEMVHRAAQLKYSAIAITDECSIAGVVRAHEEALKQAIQLIIGSEFRCEDGLHFVALAQSRLGYGSLCELITRGRRAAPKGGYRLTRKDVSELLRECLVIWLPGAKPSLEQGDWMRRTFTAVWLGIELHRLGDDRGRLHTLQRLGERLGMRVTACGGAVMHSPERKPLQDVVTAIRINEPLVDCGYALQANAAAHLRVIDSLQAIFPAELLEETVQIAKQCHFSLTELRYEYPHELVPEGETPTTWLRKLTVKGAQERWPDGVPDTVRELLEFELQLIDELKYEPFFLTVFDVVREAKSRGILCQGRGSAANSAVCYCLGITAVDPARQEVLFARFLSRERREPPDIDVDFEHERREEVIQYIYSKYGRHRAGLAATVITYRLKSALRDVGKALGFDALQIERLGLAFSRRSDEAAGQQAAWIREAGFEPDNPRVRSLLARVGELIGFPRHLSQHVGGFVLAAERLDRLVPIENASMPDRTVIQWDKDDLESLGLLKVDVLALGIMTAMRKTMDLHNGWYETHLTLDSVPAEDPATYAMIQQADTVGVFQIESRAQMSMLPRLKPACFYDLVIEVAIVRPGPIQGDMVHPYLRRREGAEPIEYPSEEVKAVLKRTLGVPIFQEQVMQLAVVAAGFTLDEADSLRRAMAAWRRDGNLEPYREKLLRGLQARGYPEEFAHRIYRQILGFGEYGFPESHAASFALLTYATSYLKRHTPAAFTAALLNSQPMGFYAPAQLVRDCKEHGVTVLPVDVTTSDWDCTLEGDRLCPPQLRLGMRLVKGLSENGAKKLLSARVQRRFQDLHDLAARSNLHQDDLDALAAANALNTLAGNRHQTAWTMAGTDVDLPLFVEHPTQEATPLLRPPTEGENIVADYHSVGLTLHRHPLALLREMMQRHGITAAAQLKSMADGEHVRTAGLVTIRQRPGSAHNTAFVTLEDETDHVQVIVWMSVAEQFRLPFLRAQLLEVYGRLQHAHNVTHLVAEALVDRSDWLGRLKVNSRDFR